jgi:hypothetical protein
VCDVASVLCRIQNLMYTRHGGRVARKVRFASIMGSKAKLEDGVNFIWTVQFGIHFVYRTILRCWIRRALCTNR